MKREIIGLIIAGSTLLAGLSVWGMAGLNHHLIVAIDRMGDTTAGLNATLASVNATVTSLNPAITNLGTLEGKLGKTLDTVNAPCHVFNNGLIMGEDGKACGTLADVNQTLRTIRGTFGVIEMAAYHEEKRLTTLDKQEADLTAEALGTLQSINATIVETKPLVIETTATLGDVHLFINESKTDLLETLKDFQDLTHQSVGVMGDTHRGTNKIADDFTAKSPWYKQIWPEAHDLIKIFAGVKLAR